MVRVVVVVAAALVAATAVVVAAVVMVVMKAICANAANTIGNGSGNCTSRCKYQSSLSEGFTGQDTSGARELNFTLSHNWGFPVARGPILEFPSTRMIACLRLYCTPVYETPPTGPQSMRTGTLTWEIST